MLPIGNGPVRTAKGLRWSCEAAAKGPRRGGSTRITSIANLGLIDD